MITIRITRKVMLTEVDAILRWLKDYEGKYRFTGRGLELVTFDNDMDAIVFRLIFSV